MSAVVCRCGLPGCSAPPRDRLDSAPVYRWGGVVDPALAAMAFPLPKPVAVKHRRAISPWLRRLLALAAAALFSIGGLLFGGLVGWVLLADAWVFVVAIRMGLL